MAKAEGSIETRIGFLRSSYETLSPILYQRSWNGWPTTRGTMVFPQRFFFYWQRTPHHGGTTAELSSKLSRVLCGHVSFQNLPLPRWLLANIATSRLQCRKPSLLKVVNKPALQIPRGATRRCGLSEGGWESGRRRCGHSGWSAGPSCAFTTLSVFPGVSLYWPLHYLLWLGFRPFTFPILHHVSAPNVMEHICSIRRY